VLLACFFADVFPQSLFSPEDRSRPSSKTSAEFYQTSRYIPDYSSLYIHRYDNFNLLLLNFLSALVNFSSVIFFKTMRFIEHTLLMYAINTPLLNF
jgi:hypothetical protein